MTAKRIVMQGSTLKLTITGTPTLIENVTTISDIVPMTRAQVSITALDDSAEQTAKGLLNWGSLKFSIMRDPTDSVHQALETQAQGSDDSVITATLPNTAATTIAVTGPIVSSSSKGGGNNDKFMTDYELKINSVVETP